jgi:transcriptional regulator GlxA family with amidase domain
MQHQNHYHHYHPYSLSRERVLDISQRLHHFMQTSKPFLKYRYSIRSLAEDIDVQAYQLSAYLNKEINLRFNDYLNQFRIQHCENLIRRGMVKDLNLKGLALICGFQNRNTLTSAFKKFTGLTPSGYFRYIRSSEHQ